MPGRSGKPLPGKQEGIIDTLAGARPGGKLPRKSSTRGRIILGGTYVRGMSVLMNFRNQTGALSEV